MSGSVQHLVTEDTFNESQDDGWVNCLVVLSNGDDEQRISHSHTEIGLDQFHLEDWPL